MYNKRICQKTNEKKLLHKIGKQWCTVSIAMLSLIGGGAVVNHAVHAATAPQTAVAPVSAAGHNSTSQSATGRIQQSAHTLHANLMAAAPVQTKPASAQTQPKAGPQQSNQTKPVQSAQSKSQLTTNHNAAVRKPVQNIGANQSTMPNNSQNNQGNVNLRYRDLTVNTPIQFLDIHGKPYSNMTLPFGNDGVKLDANGVWHYQKNDVSVNETNGNTTVPFISYDGADAQGHGLSNSDGTYHGYWGFDVKGLRSGVNSTIKPLNNLNAVSGLHIHADKNNNITYQNNDKYLVMQSEPSYDKADFSYSRSNDSDDALDNSVWAWTTNDITEGSVYQDVPVPSTVFNQLKMKDIDDADNQQAYRTKYAHDGNLPVSHFFNPNFNEGAWYKPGYTTAESANSDYYGLEPRKYPRKVPVYLEDVTNKDEDMIKHGAVTKGYIEDNDATYGADNTWSVNDNDVQNDFKTNDGTKNPFNSKTYTLRSTGNLLYSVGISQSDVINDGYPNTDYVYNPDWYQGDLTYNNQHIGWYDSNTKTVTDNYQVGRIPVIEYYHHNPIPPNGINVDIPSFWTYVRYWNPEYNPNYKQGDKLSDYYLPYSSNASDNSNPYLNDKNVNDDGKTSVTEHNGHKYYANNIATFYNYGSQDEQAPANAVIKEHFSNAQGMYQNMYYTNSSDTYYVLFKTTPEQNGHYSVTPEILNHNDSDLSVSMAKQSQPKIGDIRIVKDSNGNLMAVKYEGTASDSTTNSIPYNGFLKGYRINPFYPTTTRGEVFSIGTTDTVVPYGVHASRTENSDLFLPAGSPVWQIMGSDADDAWPKYLGYDNGSFYTGISTMNQEVNIYPENDNAAMVSPFTISSARYQGEAKANDLIAPNVHGQIIKDGMITINSNTNQVSNQDLSLPAGAPLISFGDWFNDPVPNEPGTFIGRYHYLIYHDGQYYLAYDSATKQYVNPVEFNPNKQANKLMTPIQTKHSYLYNSYKMPDLNVYAYPQHATLGYVKSYSSDAPQDLVGPTKTITIYPTDKIIYDKNAKGLRIQSYHHVDDDLVNHNNGDGLMVGTPNGDHTDVDDNPESGIILPKPASWKYNWNAQYSNGGSWYQPGIDRRNEWRQPGTDTMYELGTGNKTGYALVNVGQPKNGANINVFYFKLDTGQEFNSDTAQNLVPVSWRGDLSNDFSIYPFLPKATKQADGTYMIDPSEQKKFDGYKYLVSYTLPTGGIQQNTSQSAFVYLSKIDPNAQREPLTIRYFDSDGHNLEHNINLNGLSTDTINDALSKSNQKLWDYKSTGDNELGIDFDNNVSAPYTDFPNDAEPHYQDATNPIFAVDNYNNGRAMFSNHRYINIILFTPEVGPGKAITKTIQRTIRYQNAQGQQVAPDKIQTVTYSRTPEIDNNNVVISDGTWSTEDNTWSDVSSPSVKGYDKISQANVPQTTVPNNGKNQTVTVIYSKTPTNGQITVQYVDKLTNAVIKTDQPVTESQGKLFDIQPYTKTLPSGYNYAGIANVPDKFTNGNQTAIVYVVKKPVQSSITVQVVIDGQAKPYSTVTTTDNAGTPFKFNAQNYQMPKGYTVKSIVGQPSQYTNNDQTVTITVAKPRPKTSAIIVKYVDKANGQVINTATPVTSTVNSNFTIKPYLNNLPKGYTYQSTQNATDKFTAHNQVITILIAKKTTPKPVQPKKPSVAMGKITVDYVDMKTGKVVSSTTMTQPVGYDFNSHTYLTKLPKGYQYHGIKGDTTQFMPSAQTVDIYINKPVPKPNSSASQPAHSASAKPQSGSKARPSSASKPSSSSAKSAASNPVRPASGSAAKSTGSKQSSSSSAVPSSSAKPSNAGSKAKKPDSVPAKPASKTSSQSTDSSSSAKGSTSAKSASSQSIIPRSKASSAQSRSTVPSSKANSASSSSQPSSANSSVRPSSSAKAPIEPSSASTSPSSSAMPSSTSALVPSSTDNEPNSASQPSETASQSTMTPASEQAKPTSSAKAQSLSASLSANKVHDEQVLHSLEDKNKYLAKHNAVEYVRSELAHATNQLNADKQTVKAVKSAQSAIGEVSTANSTNQPEKAGRAVNQPLSYGVSNTPRSTLVRTVRVPQTANSANHMTAANNKNHGKLPQTGEATGYTSIAAVFATAIGGLLAVLGRAFDRKYNK